MSIDLLSEIIEEAINTSKMKKKLQQNCKNCKKIATKLSRINGRLINDEFARLSTYHIRCIQSSFTFA